MSGVDPSDVFAEAAATSVLGSGETVVLMLHGLGGDRNQPLGLLSEPLGAGLTVIAPDQRAHGETTVVGEPDDFTVDRLADDAVALLRSRGLIARPIIVVGISMGAAVALRLLQRGGLRVRGGLLVRPAFGEEPWPEHLRVFRDVAGLLRAQGADGVAAFAASEAYKHVAEVSPAAAESLLAQFTKPGAAERVVRLKQVPANPSITWDGRWTPSCPVTVLGAEADPVHPLWVAELWHERIAGSELIVTPSRDREPEAYDEQMRAATRRCLDAWADDV
jgi:pimeloyl-ACP methyl ester carboxylesterase